MKEESCKKVYQFGIPDWLIESLNLPESTQSLEIKASNETYMIVKAEFIPLEKPTK